MKPGPLCAYEVPGGTCTYPHEIDPAQLEGETLVGFTAITAPCTVCADPFHVEIQGWRVVTDKAMYEVDNEGVFYRARMLFSFDA